MSGKSERIEFIDFAKGFAISTIIVMHLVMRLPLSNLGKNLVAFGGTGVHLFIFLSGFGLVFSGYRSFSHFIKRRLMRILVPYYICVTFIFLFNQFVPVYKDGLYAYLGHIFLFKMFDERIIGSFGYPFWFISTIVQLYLLFPLLDGIRSRFGKNVLLLSGFCVSAAWWIFIFVQNLYHYRVWNSFCFQYLWEFCLGMYFAQAYHADKYKFWEPKNTLLVFVWAGSLLVSGIMVWQFGEAAKVFNDIFVFLAYGSFVIMSFMFFASGSNGRKILLKIGLVSYQLYLIHDFLTNLVLRYV